MFKNQKRSEAPQKKRGNGFSGTSFSDPDLQSPDIDAMIAQADAALEQELSPPEEEQTEETDQDQEQAQPFSGWGRCGC
jgi:hypothetical protein